MTTTHRSIYNRHGNDDTRMSNVMIRLTPEEKTEVRARAAALGYPMSVYVREVAIGHARSVVKTSIKHEAIRALADVGKQLKDLTRVESGISEITESQIKDVLRNILLLIEDINGRRS